MACSKFSYLDLANCLSKVEKLVKTLNEFADDLDKHKFNANVSKAVGGAAATVGSGLAIGGFIASFFTFGVAAVLIPVGVAIGAAGGTTVAGASIAETVIKRKKLKEAQELWNSVLDDPVMQQYLREVDEPQGEASDIAKSVYNGVKAAGQVGGAAAKTAAAVGKTALQVGKISVRALAVAGIVFEAALLPLSLYDLISSSIEAHKRKQCPAGEELRKVAEIFEKVLQELKKQLDEPAVNSKPSQGEHLAS